MRNILTLSGIAIAYATSLAAQSLSLSCPPPQKFNQSAVCPLIYSGPPVTGLQWKFATSPNVSLQVASSAPGKSLATANGIYMLLGMNATAITGTVAKVTIPAHSGAITLTLTNPLGVGPTAHAVPISPGVSVTVQ